MWDSPYQACNPSMANRGEAPEASFMAGPHVGFAHLRVRRHGRVVALGENPAAREHRDRMGEIGDHAEVMLDHQYGAVGGDRFDQRGNAIDVLMPHAGW